MDRGTEQATRSQQIEDGGAFQCASAGDGEEVGLIRPGRPSDTLGKVQDDRCGRTLDLIAKTGGRYAHP